MKLPSDIDGQNSRDARIQRVLDAYFKESSDQCIDEASLAATHPDLMPELGQQLRILRMARKARVMAESHSDSVSGLAIERDISPTEPMQTASIGVSVSCPNCHEKVNVDQLLDWRQIECSHCKQSFGLLAEDAQEGKLQAGQTIGRFQLLEPIGQGAFGSVWRARDPHLDRPVALKIPRRGDLSASEAELFLREARTAAQIRHPNVVAIHEVGRAGDRIFLVSDLIEGTSLAGLLALERLPVRRAVELVVIAARALHSLHQHGVIHRDLKPGNILLDRDGQPYLADFGLARRTQGELTMTMDGHVVGTPAYMSPEQAQGNSHSVDCRSDLYSLGVILFELLTGELPFRGEQQAILLQLATEEPPSPRQLSTAISRDLETICLKCLEKEPRCRYETAGELADDL